MSEIREILGLMASTGDTMEKICEEMKVDYLTVRAACTEPEWITTYKMTIESCRGRVTQRIIDLERALNGAMKRERGVFFDYNSASASLNALKVLHKIWTQELSELPTMPKMDATDLVDAFEAELEQLVVRH